MQKVFIIAEAGVNHNGSVETAKKMVDAAYDAGVDAVKFQTFIAEKLVSTNAPKANYQKKSTGAAESQLDMIKKLELDVDAHHQLLDYCQSKNVLFLSTPFDLDSVTLLDNLGLEIFKIGSGEITNLPYLEKIGALKKQVILSTGMADLKEIEAALDILISSGTVKDNITVLHANTEYPTPMCDVNLKAMQTIADTFDVKIGYSDHTLGIEIDIAAVAMGAVVIEKHFTLDATMPGPDHQASLEPTELKAMVTAIRNVELALGDGIKQPSASEKPNMAIARKSLVATCAIKKGEIFTKENISIKRPGTGVSPMLWYEYIGKTAEKSYEADELL